MATQPKHNVDREMMITVPYVMHGLDALCLYVTASFHGKPLTGGALRVGSAGQIMGTILHVMKGRVTSMAAYGTSDDYPDYAYTDDLRKLQTAFAELREVCGTLLDETRHLAESNGKCWQPESCRCRYHQRLRKITDAAQKLQNIQF